jgi:hypothetical protein
MDEDKKDDVVVSEDVVEAPVVAEEVATPEAEVEAAGEEKVEEVKE